MVTKWGFSKEVGPVLYESEQQGYLGAGATSSDFTENSRAQVDEEVKRILADCYNEAERVLNENKDILEAMKDALMEYETLLPDQIKDLMERKPVQPPKNWGKTAAAKEIEKESGDDNVVDINKAKQSDSDE